MAQVIHAAGESSIENLPSDTFAIALSVKDEGSLLSLEKTLLQASIQHKAIREPDAPWNGSLMAIGIIPQNKENLRRFLSTYPLYK